MSKHCKIYFSWVSMKMSGHEDICFRPGSDTEYPLPYVIHLDFLSFTLLKFEKICLAILTWHALKSKIYGKDIYQFN